MKILVDDSIALKHANATHGETAEFHCATQKRDPGKGRIGRLSTPMFLGTKGATPKMSDKQFVHLHTHSAYSMLDGLSDVDVLFQRAAELGMPALAITDHGNMHAAYDTYKMGKKHGVKGIVGCLLKGQEILTTRGVVAVENIAVGDMVLTHRGRFRQVREVMSRPYAGKAYRVHINGATSRTLTLTEEHPILVRDYEGKVGWSKPGAIPFGRRGRRGRKQDWHSFICQPKLEESHTTIDSASILSNHGFVTTQEGVHKAAATAWYSPVARWPKFPSKFDLDYALGYFLGLYTAEGHYSVREDGTLVGEVGFTFNIDEDHLLDTVTRFAESVGANVRVYSRQPHANAMEVRLAMMPLAILLRELIPGHAKEKFVPECILNGPGEAKQGYLDGLLAGDGSRKLTPNGSYRWTYKTSSQNLAWGVRALLANLGHWCNITEGVETVKQFPGGRPGGKYCYYMLSWSPERAYSRSFEDDDYIYKAIQNIETVDHLETQVYNFEVEEDNSYVSDFILHNCEAYMAPGSTSRKDKKKIQWAGGGGDDVSGGGAFHHITLLAENNTGRHNLFKISSEAYMSGFYHKARADKELLAELSEGIIASTGCPSGEVQTWLRLDEYDNAKAAAGDLLDIFGRDNLFVELMDHGLSIETRVRQDLLRIAKEMNLPLLATNDAHYARQGQAAAHSHMLCVQSGSKLSDPNRFQFDGDGYYLKSAEEMRLLFSNQEDACDNTLWIAERCDVSFNEGADLMPRFPVPEGESEDSWLEKEVYRGLEKRLPDGVPQEYLDRAAYEIGVIQSMRFPGYFLVTADLCAAARDRGVIVGPGRGCLGGESLVWTTEGRKPIRELCTTDKVFDQNGKPVSPTTIHKYECEEELVTIQPYYGGNSVSFTTDHKVLVKKQRAERNPALKAQGYKFAYEYGKPEWVPAGEIIEGDLVCMPAPHFNMTKLPTLKNPIWDAGANGHLPGERLSAKRPEDNYDSGVLLGMWIGNGWLRSDEGPVIGFCVRKSNDDGYVEELVRRVLGEEVRFHSNDSATRDLRQFTVRHKGLREWFAELFQGYRYKSNTKHIPDCFWGLSRDFLIGLRDGLWITDGSHVSKSTYSTTSEILADQVALLLNMLGLPASIVAGKRYDGRTKKHWIEYRVTTSHYFGNIKGQVGRDYDGEYLYYRVREVGTRQSDGYVYDITVPTTSSYVADGFVVHNSAAGSLVAYAMEITQIDPLAHGLLFERFLNPDRVSMPDIDIDFDDINRGKVIDYVTEKYGADHVSQLVTFGRVKAKAAIKDAARILGKPYSLGEQITKTYPKPIAGKDMPLSGLFDPEDKRYGEGEELRQLLAGDPEAKEVLDVALGLEGVVRQSGVHAAGMLIGGEPLVDHIPLIKRESDGQVISAFEQKICETLGLLKMDFLGLRNLSIMSDALAHVKARHGIEIDMNTLPTDDAATYELLRHGDTLGVFQLDSPPMRQLLKSMAPDCFNDIAAVLALYRPGPMGMNAHVDYADRKNGRAVAKPIHPELANALEPILRETQGILLYQEQPMRIAQELAGYTLGQADLLRRAMGKKDAQALEAERSRFVQGMSDNGFSADAAEAIFAAVLSWSDYGFNKSHSYSYGMISYQTAYLKANYPSEYMAALLTSVESDKDKTALYLNECRRMGISVLPPDVNESGAHYTPVDGSTIRVGLSAVRNVGHNVVDGILEHRTRDGAYTGFADFLQKTMYASVNKRAVASLIKAGAFDSLHGNRAALDSVHERAVDQVAKLRKKNPEEKDLFDLLSEETGVDSSPKVVVDVPPDSVVADWSRLERLSFEREMLGQYVSDHPLRGMQQSLDKFSDGRVLDLFPPDGLPVVPGEFALVSGIITSVTKKKTRKGDTYVIVSVEDLSGAVDVTVFPSTYNRNPDLWVADTVVSVKARVDVREDESFQLLASQAREVVLKPDPVGEDGVPLEDVGHPKFQRRVGGVSVERDPSETVLSARVPAGSLLLLTVDGAGLTPEFIGWLRGFIQANPGEVRVHLRVVEPSGERLVVLPPELSIGLTRELVYDLKGRLGEDHVSVVPMANQGSVETAGDPGVT